jgi:biotin operon repressor
VRRADRLFRIVQYLRGRRLTTAAFLAGRLGVSLRTVYRDVRDLSLSGVPVEGEAGVGYRLKAGFDVPPLMFTLNEIEALAIGARMVEAWGGPVLADSARTAIEKIVAALPAERRMAVEQTRLYAPNFHVNAAAMARLEAVPRSAIGECCGSITAMRRARGASGRCGRSRSISGAAPGRSAPGARRATTGATSGSIASPSSRRSSGAIPTRRAGASPTTCAQCRLPELDYLMSSSSVS